MKKLILVLLILTPSFVLATGFVPDGGKCCVLEDCINPSTCECQPDCTITDGKIDGTPGICGPTGAVICPFSKHMDLESLIKAITDYIFYLSLVVCPLMIVIGAFLFLTSAGDVGRTTLGKNLIKWAVIGLAFILFSKGLFHILKDVLMG